MKKTIILYYTNTGNSKFIAEKLSSALNCESIQVFPRIKGVLTLFLISAVKLSIGTNITTKTIEPYDQVIIIGPIWGGLLIAPLRNLIQTAKKAGKTIHFAVCCETGEEHKDDKYGYNQVLNQAKILGGTLIKSTAAFSSALVNLEGKKWTPNPNEKIKITEDNYKGAMEERVKGFVQGHLNI